MLHGLSQDQVDVCKHVVCYCVQVKKDIERITQAQHAAKLVFYAESLLACRNNSSVVKKKPSCRWDSRPHWCQ